MRVTNRATLLLSAGLALALAGCGSQNERQTAALSGNEFFPDQPNGALPLTNQGAPLRVAPSSASLPRAHPISYNQWDNSPDTYGYIDQADDLFDLIGDAPPDYDVMYDDSDYWAWQFDDGYVTYVEPLDTGYRYYYYEPGAVTPFLVRDPQYSYAYQGGRVAAVYAGGRLVTPDFAQPQAAQAAAYFARGRALRSAAASPNNRRSVPAPVWAERRAAVLAPRAEWNAARQRQPEWRTYRTRVQASGRNADFAAERTARAEAGQRFDNWQRQGFRGAAPQLYAPARGAAAVAAGTVRQAPAAVPFEPRREAGRAAIQPANPSVAIDRQAERARTLQAGQPAQLREAGQAQLRAARDQQRAQLTQAREQAQAQARVAHVPQQAQVRAATHVRIEQRQQTVELHRQPPQPHFNPPPQMGVRQIQAQQPHVAAPPRQPAAVAPQAQPRAQAAQPGRKDHDKH